MKKLLSRFWRDEAGFVISSELVLVATILVIGMIAGLNTVKDQVVQELGDVASAVSNVNQSYAYEGVTGHTSATAGSLYLDQNDFCDTPADPPNAEPACLIVQNPPLPEGVGPVPNQ